MKPLTIEKKLQLLQDIALEFSIKWDSRGFQQRIANSFAFAQVCPLFIYFPFRTDEIERKGKKDDNILYNSVLLSSRGLSLYFYNQNNFSGFISHQNPVLDLIL